MGFVVFLCLVGIIGFIAGIIMLIINAIKKSSKKRSLIIIGVSILLFIIGVAVSASIGDSTNDSSETEESSSVNIDSDAKDENSDSEESDASVEETKPKEVNPADYNSGITYDNLARTPDDHIGDKIKLSGEIAQVIEGDDSSQYRMAVDQDYDKIVLIEVPKELLSSRILENDLITIYGESQGTVDYESTMGGTITVPAITVDKFEVTGKAE